MNAPRRPSLSLVITTYEWSEALDVMLRSLADQADDEFEVVVAEDGSGRDTPEVVERWRGAFGNRLGHVRQPDQGWRLSRARNLGALHSRGRFIVFLDGDCLPRRGFIEAVRRAALPGWFLASKRLHLSEELSRRVLENGEPVWRWSALGWMIRSPSALVTTHREAGSPGLILPLRDRRRPWRRGQPEFSPPYDAYGFFLGVWRSDFEAVNGFDMRFSSWGGEDTDLTNRLRRYGLRCGWPGPATTMLHLWHPPRKAHKPVEALSEAGTNEEVEAVQGLRELDAELVVPGADAG